MSRLRNILPYLNYLNYLAFAQYKCVCQKHIPKKLSLASDHLSHRLPIGEISKNMMKLKKILQRGRFVYGFLSWGSSHLLNASSLSSHWLNEKFKWILRPKKFNKKKKEAYLAFCKCEVMYTSHLQNARLVTTNRRSFPSFFLTFD